MGFAGYFSMVLYKDVILSTVPATHSKDMISWFPALLPLREFLRVQEGDEVRYSQRMLFIYRLPEIVFPQLHFLL